MTDMVDVAAKANARLWRERVGLATMLSDPQLDSSEDILDASDSDSPATPPDLDSRKRKEVSAGADAALVKFAKHKRNKQAALSQYSGASSDNLSTSMAADAVGGKNSLMMPTEYGISSPLGRLTYAEPGTSAEARGVPEADTSGWSTDNEYSGGHTSAFTSSEDGSSQRLQYLDPFLRSDRNISGCSKQAERPRLGSWSAGGNLLQLQLGSYINKEKQKLDSESADGSSGGSKDSLSDSLRGYGSMEPPRTRILDERSSGSSASLSGFVGASSSLVDSGQARPQFGMMHPSHTNSMLLSRVKNKNHEGLGPFSEDNTLLDLNSKLHVEEKERIFLTDTVRGVRRSPFSSKRLEEEVYKLRSHDLHQKFVLSSGRLSQVEAAQSDKRTSTIDRDFDDYFANLML